MHRVGHLILNGKLWLTSDEFLNYSPSWDSVPVFLWKEKIVAGVLGTEKQILLYFQELPKGYNCFLCLKRAIVKISYCF